MLAYIVRAAMLFTSYVYRAREAYNMSTSSIPSVCYRSIYELEA